jgi:hypothetical protein
MIRAGLVALAFSAGTWLKTMVGVDVDGCERQALRRKHKAETDKAWPIAMGQKVGFIDLHHSEKASPGKAAENATPNLDGGTNDATVVAVPDIMESALNE